MALYQVAVSSLPPVFVLNSSICTVCTILHTVQIEEFRRVYIKRTNAANFGVSLYLYLHHLKHNDQIRSGNTWGEGLFLRGQQCPSSQDVVATALPQYKRWNRSSVTKRMGDGTGSRSRDPEMMNTRVLFF